LNRIRGIAVLLLLLFLLPLTPRFVGIIAIVPDHLFPPARNMGYKPGQKVEGKTSKSTETFLMTYLIMFLQAIFTLNSLSHAFAAFYNLTYLSGAATAILIQLPFSYYFFRIFKEYEYISFKKIALITGLGLVLIVPLVLLFHQIGLAISKISLIN
jgi:hypothetical protein